MSAALLAFGAFGAGMALANRLRATQEHRSEPAALSDLLAWAHLVAPGVVLQKDGSFLAGWKLRGPDVAASTTEEMNLLARRVNDAFLPYADGWVFHFDAIRRRAPGYAPAGAFPDPVTAVIDAERRAAYESGADRFETDTVLTATFRPEREAQRRIARLLMNDPRAAPGWEHELDSYRRALDDLQDRLSAWARLDRLGSDRLLTHLHHCLTSYDHPVLAPPDGAYLAHLLADQVLVAGARPVIAPGTPRERHLRVVAIHRFPAETWSAQLEGLARLPLCMRWSNRVIPLGRRTADRLIRQQQQQWFRARKSAAQLIGKREKSAAEHADDQLFENAHAREMTAKSAEALAVSAAGAARFCHFNGNVVIAEATAEAADRAASRVVKYVTDRGFTARIETLNAFDAFLGTLPGHGFPNVRRPMLSSRNIADLLPLTSVWAGEPVCPCPFYPPGSPALLWADAEGSTPFRLNLHQGDVGHTLVVGATGAGKSTMVAMLAAQFFRYDDAQVFVFDKGRSYELLTVAAGGRHYDIRPDGDGFGFQPLAGVEEADERVWAAEWLETLLTLQGVEVTGATRASVAAALELVARMPRERRTLSAMRIQVQDPALRQALAPYCSGGAFGGLLDAESDGLADGALQTFEMHRLLDLGDAIAVPLLLYLFRRIEQRLDGRPSLVVIEEAWQPLTHGRFAERIKEWLLTWRKRNAAVVLVTQSLAQLYELPARHVVLDSCPTRILLPNPQAATPAAARLYREIGLNDREIETLAGARPKREYYYRGAGGSRLFELRLGPAALAFLSARDGLSLDETLRRARDMAAADPAGWVGRWLDEAGIHDLLPTPRSHPGDPHEADSTPYPIRYDADGGRRAAAGGELAGSGAVPPIDAGL